MAKTSTRKFKPQAAKLSRANPATHIAERQNTLREPSVDPFVFSNAQFDAVMQAAERSGLLSEKTGRIGGRDSPALMPIHRRSMRKMLKKQQSLAIERERKSLLAAEISQLKQKP